MKLETIFQSKIVLCKAVPLTIQEPGIAYLNDIHLWVITFNTCDPSFQNDKITIGQMKDLMEHHCFCYANQAPIFEKERQQIIERLNKEDMHASIDFIFS